MLYSEANDRLLKAYGKLKKENSRLRERLKHVEDMVPRTADDKLVPDCDKLYCPECCNQLTEGTKGFWCLGCYQNNILYPDHQTANQTVLFIDPVSCYSTPKAAKAAKEND